MTATSEECDLLVRGTVTVPGAVREFGISRSRLYELMTSGQLVYSQPLGSRRRLIPRLCLERIIRAGLIGATRQSEEIET
jgi:hypothetical protein